MLFTKRPEKLSKWHALQIPLALAVLDRWQLEFLYVSPVRARVEVSAA